ncbi:MAG: hypothetical protein AB1664_04780 [Thermodesulfobacteriota bacterium]
MHKTIYAADLVRDFRLGMGDQALMVKYRLNEKQLEWVFEELWRRNLISEYQSEDQPDVADSEVTFSFLSAEEGTRESA